MKGAAIFIGMPRSVTVAGGSFVTGGSKTAARAALLCFEKFMGDGQGNPRHHGGKDRSVCVYIAEHYARGKSVHGYEMQYGAFCENLTLEGVREDAVCIGDVFQAGQAVIQISLPRARSLPRAFSGLHACEATGPGA